MNNQGSYIYKLSFSLRVLLSISIFLIFWINNSGCPMRVASVVRKVSQVSRPRVFRKPQNASFQWEVAYITVGFDPTCCCDVADLGKPTDHVSGNVSLWNEMP